MSDGKKETCDQRKMIFAEKEGERVKKEGEGVNKGRRWYML